MKQHRYDPEVHHRRSIRLKGHDYAGGGTYFVTICAHRDAGDIFADESVKAMVGRVWEGLPQVGAGLVSAALAQGTRRAGAFGEGTHEACPYVVMPDHFHGIVRIAGGGGTLGDVVGAFKSCVVHEYIAGVKAGRFAPFPGKIWHRNYYERILWRAEDVERVEEYIRMNPWRLILEGLILEGTHEGRPYRGIGNPGLLNAWKVGMLCSRDCPEDVLGSAVERAVAGRAEQCVVSGFHSPPEKAILEGLLESEARLICCPAWGIDAVKIPSEWLPVLRGNRMLILEMGNRNGDLAAARERNAFVLRMADECWLPHVSPCGMLARLVAERDGRGACAGVRR